MSPAVILEPSTQGSISDDNNSTLTKDAEVKLKERVKLRENNNSTVSQNVNRDIFPEFNETLLRDSDNIVQATALMRLPNVKLNEFLWTTAPQAHAVRRRAILQKYPEVESLYGADRSQAAVLVTTVILQLFLSYVVSVSSMPLWAYIALVFWVSGTLNHSLFAAMHEASHGTIFTSTLGSELLCILATVPMGLPAAIPFKRYHLEHHIYQGVTEIDPDLPTEFEARFFNSTLGKLLWIFLLPFTYSLRPMIMRPKKVVFMDCINWILSATVNIYILYFWGLRSLLYLLLGTFFSMNFHPFAGHFISEHFIFPESDAYQETNSYYGFWNKLTYNVGYHNEHHDFPRVSGSRLPLLRQVASEFYDMPYHDSWAKVMLSFIFLPNVTPFNRVRRMTIKGGVLPDSAKAGKLHKGIVPYGGVHYFWPRVTK